MRLDYASQEPPPRRRFDSWLLLLLLLALAIRLGWTASRPTDPASLEQLPDQQEYAEIGRNLFEAHNLGFADKRFGDVVYAYRMPGYPALIALCRVNMRTVRLVQAMLDASTVLAVYLLARRWAPRGPALLSAGFVVVNPFLIYLSGTLLSETLFTAMLIWGMVLLVVPPRRIAWIIGALLLVLSILVRPSALLLPVCLCILGALNNRDHRRIPPMGTIALALTLLTLFPWAWRNSHVVGSWIWTTTNGGISLYDGLNPDATGASDQTFVSAMPQLKTMGEVGRSQYLGEMAIRYASEHPVRVAELAAIKIARIWSPIPLSKEYGGRLILVVLAATYMIPLYVLIILGLRYGSAPWAAKSFLVAPAVYFTIVHAVSVGSLRYRIPADVPMAVLAGLAVGILSRPRKEHAPGQEASAANP